MTRHLIVVLTRGLDEHQAEFEDWYDAQHLGDVMAVPGVVSAERFRVEHVASDTPAPDWTSLAIYEIAHDDPQAVLAEIRRRAKTSAMPLTAALDKKARMQVVVREIEPSRRG
jgi:hypothetical protein